MSRGHIILLLFAVLTFSQKIFAQSGQEKVVGEFGDCMSSWCQTGEILWREKIEKLVEGVKGCRVDDGLMQLFVKNDTSSLLSQGTAVVDNYLNCFDKSIENGLTYKHGLPVWQESYVEPTVYADKKEAPLYFVSMDVETSGTFDYNGTDLFYVRGGQITKIIDFGGDNSLASAIRLYSQHKYEEAFRLFRKLAYENPNNYDAQYYTAVMEIKRQGCDFLSKKVRDMEAAWWIARGTWSYARISTWDTKRFLQLYARFTVNEALLPFRFSTEIYTYCLASKKLVTHGLMAYQVKGKYGFINEEGRIVVPCRYDRVFPFGKNGRALVSRNNKIGYVDTNGEEVVRVQYDNGMLEFLDGKTYVILNGSLLLIDEEGNLLKDVGIGYDFVLNDFVGGMAYAHNQAKGLYDLFDLDGNISSIEQTPYNIDYYKNCYFTKDIDGNRTYEQPFDWK